MDLDNNTIIQINVGGRLFTTSARTLMISPYFNSFLTRWHEADDNKILFLDRDPEGFENVLGLLRDSNYPFNSKYNYELEYFQLSAPISPVIKEFHSISDGSSTGGKETILRWNKLTMKTNKSYIITISCQDFLDCPILNTNKFSAINIYKDKILLDSLDKNIINIYNNIYYSQRPGDNPCIRLPIFHHTIKQYKKNNNKFGPINIEFIFNEPVVGEPLALFYEMQEQSDKPSAILPWYNTHLWVSETIPPLKNIIWLKDSVYGIISEIWLCLSVPIINIIIYLDDSEIVCTHNVLEELANGKQIFPLQNHYIIQKMTAKKIVNVNICITVQPIAEPITATAVICRVSDYPKTIY